MTNKQNMKGFRFDSHSFLCLFSGLSSILNPNVQKSIIKIIIHRHTQIFSLRTQKEKKIDNSRLRKFECFLFPSVAQEKMSPSALLIESPHNLELYVEGEKIVS